MNYDFQILDTESKNSYNKIILHSCSVDWNIFFLFQFSDLNQYRTCYSTVKNTYDICDRGN